MCQALETLTITFILDIENTGHSRRLLYIAKEIYLLPYGAIIARINMVLITETID